MQKQKKAKKAVIVCLLVLCLLCGMVPASALSFTALVADGKFGINNDLTWMLDNTGLLTVSGKGKMQDMYVQDYPWYEYAGQITAVKIQDGVQNVGTYMFEEYDNLETVEIGEGVLTIGKYSFNYCDSLLSVRIPKSLRRIDEQAFFMCPLLADVHIADASRWCGIEFMSAHANPLYNGADLLLDGKIVTEITVPDFVNAIGDYQFYGCQTLEEINLHGMVTSIGEDAFADCPSLRAILCEKGDVQIQKIIEQNTQLPKELFVAPRDEQNQKPDGDVLEKDGVLYNADMTVLLGVTEAVAEQLVVPETVTQIAAGAFGNCFALQSVTLPDTITKLPDALFENCRNLQSVTFSEKLTAIGEACFKGCLRLSAVKLPDTLQEIGAYAFSGCRSLQKMKIPDGIAKLHDGVLADCVRLADIILPERLQTIGSNAFYNCYNLTNISIPSSVTQIGTAAFADCHALQEMILPDGITELPEHMLYRCYSLTQVTLSEGLQGIGRYAFYDCILLDGLQLPDSLAKIGEYAFYGCEALSAIVLPVGTVVLEDGVFMACGLLTSMTMSETTQRIGSRAFAHCQAMDALYIPAGVQAIARDAFFAASVLQRLYFGGTKEDWSLIDQVGLEQNYEIVFEHTHTVEKWNVLTYPGPEAQGIARGKCKDCNAVQTAIIEKTAFVGNENATVNMDGVILAVAQYAVADLMKQAGEGAVLTDRNGNAVTEDAFVGTGMTLTMADGSSYTVLVIGDCDGNGIIAAEDARLALRLSVGLEDFSSDSVQYKACDVADTRGVTSLDARSILRASVGLEKPSDWKR